MAKKTLLKELGDGILNLFTSDKKESAVTTNGKKVATKTATAEKPKGKNIPVLKSIPTVKVGSNLNPAAVQRNIENKQKIDSASKHFRERNENIDKSIALNAENDKKQFADIAELRRRTDETQKMIEEQKRWVQEKMEKWENKNAETLAKMTSKVEDAVKKQQEQSLKMEAKRRNIGMRPSMHFAPKKKEGLSFRGRKSSLVRPAPVAMRNFTKPSFIANRSQSMVKPVSTPMVRPVSSPMVRPSSTPMVRPVSSPMVRPSSTPMVRPVSSPMVRPASTPMVRLVSSPMVRSVPKKEKLITLNAFKPVHVSKNKAVNVAANVVRYSPAGLAVSSMKAIGSGIKKLGRRLRRRR